MVKNLPAIPESQVRPLGQNDALEEGTAACSSAPAGESHEQRSLAGCSPGGRTESDVTGATQHALQVAGLSSWSDRLVMLTRAVPGLWGGHCLPAWVSDPGVQRPLSETEMARPQRRVASEMGFSALYSFSKCSLRPYCVPGGPTCSGMELCG